MRSRKAAATAAAATAALALTSFATSPAQADRHHPGKGKDLTKAVEVENVHKHLEEFQEIADAHDGNRGAGTPGYEASARYVEKTLKKAGYETERQYFPFLFEEVEDSSLTEVSPDSRAEAWPVLAEAAAAWTPERAAELETNIAQAVEAGVFGAPSFVTEGGLLFFGNDRLDFLRRALAA